jgi:hypothetical protein
VTPEGKRKFEGPKYRWQDNIKIHLKGTDYDKIDWIHLAQDREEWRTVLDMVMNLRVIHTVGNFCASCGTISFSRPCSYSQQYVYLHMLCFVLFVLCFCIVSFMYIYSYLFCSVLV